MKAVAVRFCLGCGARKPKKELIRLVRSKEGAVLIDQSGKIAGRGSYFCPSLDCFQKGRKKLTKALRIEGSNLKWEDIKEEFKEALKAKKV